MNQQVILNRIRTLLSRFEEEVRIDNANGEFSINTHAENVLIKVLNVAYSIELKNINYVEGKTVAAIDLGDESNRITFQISSTGTVDKVVGTLIKFEKYQWEKKYEHLYFYFLKGMDKDVVISNKRIVKVKGKLKEENIHFLDHAQFYKYLNQINDMEKYIEIQKLLEEQFADSYVFNSHIGLMGNPIDQSYVNREDTRGLVPKCLTGYMPIGPEIGLIGRESVVNDIHAMLDDSSSIALLYGVGGIGKTAVMQKVCNDIIIDGNNMNHVAWITCSDSLEDDLLMLRDSLGVPESLERNDAYAAVIKKLKDFDGTLYLFMDNMERMLGVQELGKLNSLRPKVRVIISSRQIINAIPHEAHIELTELKSDSSVELFYGYYGRDEARKYEAYAQSIVDSVYKNTLLIELVAKAAKQSFGSLDAFKDKLEKNGIFEVYQLSIINGHNNNMTIEECIRKLYDISNLSPEQKRIMRLFSIFTPERVIYGKVVEWAELDGNEVNSLVNLGWLVRMQEGLVIHQIVKDSLARQVGDNLKIEEYGELIERVADTKSYLSASIGYYRIKERITLAEDIARFLDKKQNMLSSDNMQFSVFSKLAALFGKKDKKKRVFLSTVVLFNNLGDTYRVQGDYAKANEYYNKLLDTNAVLVTEHSITATMYNNMAVVYRMRKDYEKALKYYRKALTIQEQTSSNVNQLTAAIYNNMALVYSEQGDFENALSFYKEALQIQEEVLGKDHPDTATTYNNIGGVYYNQNDLVNALEYHNKALSIRKHVLESEHPSIATSYNNIALVYSKQEDHANALYYYGKALAIQEKVMGADHPNTATMYNNIGKEYHYLHEYPKALMFYNKALPVLIEKLGENDPYTQDIQRSIKSIKSHKTKKRRR